MPRTHIIVPSTGDDLDGLVECLLGIHRCARPEDRICLVANGNPAGTNAWVELDAHRPRGGLAAIVPYQIGYKRAVRLGLNLLAEAGAEPDDYLCVLHDDVEVQGDFLTPLRGALDRGAALVGPSLRTEQGHDYLEDWCWAAKICTFRGITPWAVVHDSPNSLAGAVGLSQAIQFLGGLIRPVVVPLRHLSR